jgi:hypothetical protein
MTGPQQGRHTARLDQDGVVVFLIGMRINHWWRPDLWLWMSRAMGEMLRYLHTHPEAGMISARNWFGRTTMQVGYWRSVEHLTEFAKATDLPHAPAWRRFNKQARTSNAVGVWHETYVVKPGTAEAVYVNMPEFGLAEATHHEPVTPATTSTARRMARI